MMVYRVQSAFDGRGPWRPGFSNIWVDHSRNKEQWEQLAAWTDEFKQHKILRRQRKGEHMGCGCLSPDQLKLWFTAQEYATLLQLGYQAVQFEARILAESKVQCIFARRLPLYQNVKPFDLY